MTIRPMLASDYDEAKLKFPLIAQPKIDGVRGINLNGSLTGRSLKPHANLYTTKEFSHPHFKGLDGEFTAGGWNLPNLCTLTTSALTSIQGEPVLSWYVFDFITEDTINLPYMQRYKALRQHLDSLRRLNLDSHIELVPAHLCTNLEQLLALEERWLGMGLEGVIIRDPEGKYKEGRSTAKEGGLLRIKRFIEEDAEVLGVVEGQANGNEAKTNELGRTERSSHQENMAPNGMVGTLTCKLLKDVHDPVTKALILTAGQAITVSAGSMNHKDRVHYFLNPDEIVLKTIKFKFFPKGIKDKPRFPTFVSIRARSDKI